MNDIEGVMLTIIEALKDDKNSGDENEVKKSWNTQN